MNAQPRRRSPRRVPAGRFCVFCEPDPVVVTDSLGAVSALVYDLSCVRVVANEKAGVQAVIIPDRLPRLHRLIAMSMGPTTNKCSKLLTELWKLGEVWGSPEYIETLERFVNPPVPRHCVLRFA